MSYSQEAADIPPAFAAYVRQTVQAMEEQLRAEFTSDIGTLLGEVASTSSRLDQLEEVVKAEQVASMQLLESLMQMHGAETGGPA
jgi:hypothetical protein